MAEKLGVIEPLGYANLEDLRKDIVTTLSRHIESQPYLHKAPAGRELHILSSIRFSIRTGDSARDLTEFHDALKKASPATIYLHAFESRLRSSKGVSDFSVWLENDLDENDLARQIGELNPHSQPLLELKQKILEMVATRMGEKI